MCNILGVIESVGRCILLSMINTFTGGPEVCDCSHRWKVLSRAFTSLRYNLFVVLFCILRSRGLIAIYFRGSSSSYGQI